MMEFIAVHLPLWKRLPVAQLVLRNISHINAELQGHGIALWPFLVHSPEDPDIKDADSLMLPLSAIVTCENTYLGKKWNTGWQAIQQTGHGFAGFMQLGSDNLMTPQYVLKAFQALQDGADVVGIGQCIFHQLETGNAGCVNPGVPYGYGPGRLYSRQVMDELKWKPYKDNQQRNMERTIDGHLKRLRVNQVVIPLTFNDTLLIDIKTDGGNINSFEAAKAARTKKGHWTDLTRHMVSELFPELNLQSYVS